MKPGDHPDFYKIAPPPGTSRESTIRLDADGQFWHDGERVEHEALARALLGWIAKHPDDGTAILTNGYDWCRFQLDDAPFQVAAATRVDGGDIELTLSDGSKELLDPQRMALGSNGAVYVWVKNGEWEARFSRHAQTGLEPLLVDVEGEPHLLVRGKPFAFAARTAAPPFGSDPPRP